MIEALAFMAGFGVALLAALAGLWSVYDAWRKRE